MHVTNDRYFDEGGTKALNKFHIEGRFLMSRKAVCRKLIAGFNREDLKDVS